MLQSYIGYFSSGLRRSPRSKFFIQHNFGRFFDVYSNGARRTVCSFFKKILSNLWRLGHNSSLHNNCLYCNSPFHTVLCGHSLALQSLENPYVLLIIFGFYRGPNPIWVIFMECLQAWSFAKRNVCCSCSPLRLIFCRVYPR